MVEIELLNYKLIIKLSEITSDFSLINILLKGYYTSYDIESFMAEYTISFTPNEKKDIIEKTVDFISGVEKIGIAVRVSEDLADEIEKVQNTKYKKKMKLEEIIDFKDSLEIRNNCQSFSEFKSNCDSSLNIKLREYQYSSAYILTKLNSGFDFSVPGAGKTIITYAAYSNFLLRGKVDRILVIGPKNANLAWFEEYETCFGELPDFEDLSNQNLSYVKEYLKSSEQFQKEVTFINVDKIRNLVRELIIFCKSGNILLVVDEAHKVKNPHAKSTQAILELAKTSDYKILLTGTPLPRGFEDLSSLTEIISPNERILPYNYNKLKKITSDESNLKESNEIMENLYPYYSRVSKNYLISKGELTEAEHTIVNIEMSEPQSKIYDFLNEFAFNINNRWEVEFALIMKKAVMIRKMQASSNPLLLKTSLVNVFKSIEEEMLELNEGEEIDFKTSKKIEKQIEEAELIINEAISKSDIADIIKRFNDGTYIVNKNKKAVEMCSELLRENKKVVMWDTFVNNMDVVSAMIQKELNIVPGVINGSVTGEERKQVLDDFREGNLNVLIASPATLAESISLHKACQDSIYLNRNYNGAQFIQSKDRIHRIGMPEGTTAKHRFLINSDTIDEAVHQNLLIKEQRMEKILDSKELLVGAIESEDISGLSQTDIEDLYLK